MHVFLFPPLRYLYPTAAGKGGYRGGKDIFTRIPHVFIGFGFAVVGIFRFGKIRGVLLDLLYTVLDILECINPLA